MIALRSFLTPKESKASFATHRTHTGAWKFDAAFGILCPFCSIRFSSKVPTFILKLTCWSTNFNRAKKGRNIFPKERAFELVCSKIFWFYAIFLWCSEGTFGSPLFWLVFPFLWPPGSCAQITFLRNEITVGSRIIVRLRVQQLLHTHGIECCAQRVLTLVPRMANTILLEKAINEETLWLEISNNVALNWQGQFFGRDSYGSLP